MTVADPAKPQHPWPRPQAQPEYTASARGAWEEINITDALRREWKACNNKNHFTKLSAEGSLKSISFGDCELPKSWHGRNVLPRAQLTQLRGDPEEWVMLGVRHQDDHSYVGSHLNCALHVNTGDFPRGRWSVVIQAEFDEKYDGRIEMVVAAIDDNITTFINGQQVTSFATNLQVAGDVIIRRDGPFVLHN